ncbi:MAG TPA: hypothetical protein VK116_15280 [Planctomycetota bacterium]|nr:hypothetical protein [Planctomycetota bacterium]
MRRDSRARPRPTPELASSDADALSRIFDSEPESGAETLESPLLTEIDQEAVTAIETALERSLSRWCDEVSIPDDATITAWLREVEPSEKAKLLRRTRRSLRRILWPLCILFALGMSCGLLYLAYIVLRTFVAR